MGTRDYKSMMMPATKKTKKTYHMMMPPGIRY